MKKISVIQVGKFEGGEVYLLKTLKSAAIVDTGYAYSAEDTIKNLEDTLMGQPLDLILLTHSHYDHASGCVWIKERWPEAEVVASAYAARVFTRAGAINTIRKMNRVAAIEKDALDCSYDEEKIANIRVDRTVKDGDVIEFGDLTLKVIETPGHTKCSISFYSPEEKLLIASETLGVPLSDEELVFPCILTGYKDSIDSLMKVKDLDIEHMIFSHVGLKEGEIIEGYFDRTLYSFNLIKEALCNAYLEGKRGDELMKIVDDIYYGDWNTQPHAAFLLNASYMIPVIIRETLGVKDFDLSHEVRMSL